MAASSSSSGAGKISKGPQVFINFRGKELRKGFVDYLETALEEAKINVFIDDDLEPGAKLLDLFVKIEQSKVALAILSKEYSDSEWCLDELVKIKECVDKGSLIGIPIFYKLETSVVSHLEGIFGDNFRKLKRNNQHDLVKTEKWEEALKSIPKLKGMHLAEKRFSLVPSLIYY